MTEKRYEDLEKKALKKAAEREEKKQTMPVTGRGVFHLRELIRRSKPKKNNPK